MPARGSGKHKEYAMVCPLTPPCPSHMRVGGVRTGGGAMLLSNAADGLHLRSAGHTATSYRLHTAWVELKGGQTLEMPTLGEGRRVRTHCSY